MQTSFLPLRLLTTYSNGFPTPSRLDAITDILASPWTLLSFTKRRNQTKKETFKRANKLTKLLFPFFFFFFFKSQIKKLSTGRITKRIGIDSQYSLGQNSRDFLVEGHKRRSGPKRVSCHESERVSIGIRSSVAFPVRRKNCGASQAALVVDCPVPIMSGEKLDLDKRRRLLSWHFQVIRVQLVLKLVCEWIVKQRILVITKVLKKKKKKKRRRRRRRRRRKKKKGTNDKQRLSVSQNGNKQS